MAYSEEAKLMVEIMTQVDFCEMEYMDHSKDPYLSYVLAQKRKTLQDFLECLRRGEKLEALRIRVEEKLPKLKAALDEEADHPTFDWYDEHYHYKILEGEYEAYRCVKELLSGKSFFSAI